MDPQPLAAGAQGAGEVLLQLGGVLLGLGLLGAVAHRVRLSPVPLYLLAGLAFGQHGPLPLINGAAGEEFIAVGAELGAVLLLLSLGLEYAPDELVAGLRHNAPAGLVDLVLNAVPGAALALLLGWGPVAAVGWPASPTSRRRGSSPRRSPTSAAWATARHRWSSPCS